jgi:hypothetical protein
MCFKAQRQVRRSVAVRSEQQRLHTSRKSATNASSLVFHARSRSCDGDCSSRRSTGVRSTTCSVCQTAARTTWASAGTAASSACSRSAIAAVDSPNDIVPVAEQSQSQTKCHRLILSNTHKEKKNLVAIHESTHLDPSETVLIRRNTSRIGQLPRITASNVQF